MYSFKIIHKRLIAIVIFFSIIIIQAINIPNVNGQSLDKIKVVLLLGSDSHIPLAVEAYKEIQDKYPLEIKIFSSNCLNDLKIVEELQSDIKKSNVLLLEKIGQDEINSIGTIISKTPKSCYIYGTRSDDFSKQYSNIDYSKDNEIKVYFENDSVENMRSLLLYLGILAGMQVDEDIEVKIKPNKFFYHPDAMKLCFDIDKLSNSVNEALDKASGEVNLGLITNTVHHAVYETVYNNVYNDNVIPLAQEIIKINVVSSELDEKDWENVFYSIIESQDLVNSVTDAVYKSIENKNGPKMSIVIDAAYHAFYETKDKDIKGQDLFNIINDILKSFNQSNDFNDCNDLCEQIKEIIKTKHISLGAFRNLKDYKIWYKVSNHYKKDAPWIGITAYDSVVKNNDMEMYISLLNELENNNANVIFIITDGNVKGLQKDLFMENGKSVVDIYIPTLGFNHICNKRGFNMFMKSITRKYNLSQNNEKVLK
ncbi:cobaltochelatase subunit CobN [Inediibacterium massiliense]|uniref:cobaltochelatase subunit CobN n=1 Tax=Inediibacterium massiliense TaxID=1658111 RepID=UPI0006B43505|nr:cobaltochelatase subunit CobN [Inediibacterium massiliense]